jgi:U3 small nucleolar RNA-associated protein 20
MINHVEPQALQPLLPDIVLPLYRIVEDPNTKDEQMGTFSILTYFEPSGPSHLSNPGTFSTVELQVLAREVQELLQTKIGVTLFSEAYNEVRRKATEKRQSRKAAIAVRVSLTCH